MNVQNLRYINIQSIEIKDSIWQLFSNKFEVFCLFRMSKHTVIKKNVRNIFVTNIGHVLTLL